jgi:hypothetical protein
VADDLVDDVRLGGVERLGRVADVLRGVEDAVGQRPVELEQRDEARGRVVLEAGQRPQPVGDLVELRHAVLRQAEGGLRLEVLTARVALVAAAQLAAHRPPDLVLGLEVLDPRDRRTGRPQRRRRGDLVATLAVRRIVEAGVLGPEMDDDAAVVLMGHRRVQLRFLEHLSPSDPAGREKEVTTRRGAWQAVA